MSEVSILSAEFGALSKTVDQINHSIIILKTQALNNAAENEIKVIPELEQGELEHAIEYMDDFLPKLVLLEHPNDHSPQLLPNEAVSKLTNTVITTTPDFFERLRSIQLSIDKQQVLDPSQLDLLDQIVEALDQERSELFKKLRAARG